MSSNGDVSTCPETPDQLSSSWSQMSKNELSELQNNAKNGVSHSTVKQIPENQQLEVPEQHQLIIEQHEHLQDRLELEQEQHHRHVEQQQQLQPAVVNGEYLKKPVNGHQDPGVGLTGFENFLDESPPCDQVLVHKCHPFLQNYLL